MDRSGMGRLLVRPASRRRRYRLGRVTGSLEAVEDQGEAELVLVAEVVAGLKNMPECELGQVGIGVGGKLRQHDLRERRGLLWSAERQAPVHAGGILDTPMAWTICTRADPDPLITPLRK